MDMSNQPCVDSQTESHGTQLEKAERLLKSKAETGDTQASFFLGYLYYEEVMVWFPCTSFPSIITRDLQISNVIHNVGIKD